MKKTHVIAILSNKGGVGKTTTAVNTAARLAQLGYDVLVVDTDKQCNLTHTFLEYTPKETIYEYLMGTTSTLPKRVVRQKLTLVPASAKLFGIEGQLRSKTSSNQELVRCVEGLLTPELGKYDYIIIDTSSVDNILTISALAFVRDIILVIRPEQYSVEALRDLFQYLRRIKEAYNKKLRLAGILITGVVLDSVGHVKGVEYLRRWLPKFVLNSVIRNSRPLYTSILSRQDVFTYAPFSNGACDYRQFVDELIVKIKTKDEKGNW
ncbi:MAG: ParA family protein [Bacteroidales bacterium]|nr:ParA family protein [Bacteroidales bacterium]